MLSDPVLSKYLLSKHPSISYGASNLYAHGIYEEETRPNLGRRVVELVPQDNQLLTVNDKKLHAPLRVRLRYSSSSSCAGMMEVQQR